jgi:transposase, IS5 family
MYTTYTRRCDYRFFSISQPYIRPIIRGKQGKFGQGKYGCRLNNIRARRADTSTAWINSIFLVMNLLVLVQAFIGLKKIVIKITTWTNNATMSGKIVLKYNRQFISSRNLAW